MSKYNLNGTNVHEGMYRRAVSARQNGGMVLLTKFIDRLEAPESAKGTHCGNCDGVGKLGLEIVTGGPYKTAGRTAKGFWHDGAWYVGDLVQFICPDCNGSGLFRRTSDGQPVDAPPVHL